MNTFKTIFAALAATAVLAGCAKEITSPSSENDKVAPDAEGSRVIAVSFAPQTKTELTDGFQPKFVDNDSILISNGVAIDTCEVKVESEVATISTNLTGPLTAVYPYKAAGMNDNNHNLIDTVLVSTEQDGTFASANICMAKMTDGNEESLSFENKTAVFCIKPAAGASSEYVEVKAEGFNIANDYPEGSTYTTCNTIHVAPITTDSVYVSILVPNGLKVNNLKFSDGTQEKAITTGARAAEAIAAGTLYTVTNADWASPEADIPEGAIKGAFSVSDDKKVYFSRGNLVATIDADGSPTAWKFHAHQYDTLGCGGANTSIGTAAGDIDLFGWSTANTTYGINTSDSDVDYSGNFIDWGKAIEDSNTWRTLTTEEWQYLFSYTSYDEEINPTGMDYRNDKRESKYKYGVTVCGKANCVVLLPDNWDSSVISLNSFAETLEYSGTTTPTWQQMEDAGAVCLPAAGYREGTSTIFVGDYGIYWSSTARGLNDAHNVCFYSEDVLPSDGGARFFGLCVRLVTDVSATPTPAPTAPEGFVDLGVKNDENEPLYWAECNLGATNAWDYGKYFSWGDVTGQTPTDNTFSEAFNWANDVFEQTFDKVSQATACPNGILASAYDAATQADPNHNWRTPTDDEFVALAANCVWGWCDGDTAKYKGTTVPGYIVYKAKNENDKGKAYIDNTWMRWDTSQLQFVTDGASEATGYDPSDTHIFFPAAGHGNGTNLLNAGSNGYYWSSSLDTDNHSNAYQLYFSSDDFVNPQDVDRRCHGFSIRPVSD